VGLIRTVTGDIEAPIAGASLIHEHLTIQLPGSSVDPMAHRHRPAEIARIGAEFRRLHDQFDLGLVVDAGPHDLGRDIEFCASVSSDSGVQVVACTGFFTSTAGILRYWREQDDADIEDFMRGELLAGVFPGGLRCGCIKVASAGYSLSYDELRIFRAAARISADLGTPIITHTDRGWQVNIGLLQLQVLRDGGANPENIAIGHVDGTSNVEWLVAICDSGAYVAIDTFGIDENDQARIDLVMALVRRGYERQLLLSHDAVGVWYERPGRIARPERKSGYAHIFAEVWPRLLEAGLSRQQFETIMKANPARLLAV
jgi:phosphotriesterase-related protein